MAWASGRLPCRFADRQGRFATRSAGTAALVVLVRMPTRKADVAVSAFAGALHAIPAPLRKTLTYDQGKEMADYHSMARATGMYIFFADPRSPWQHGFYENTNGLLGQYFSKGTSLAAWDPDDLDRVPGCLNDRPRKTLSYATPNEKFANLLAALVSENEISAGAFATKLESTYGPDMSDNARMRMGSAACTRRVNATLANATDGL